MESKKKGLTKLSLATWILIATIGGIVFGSIVGPAAGNLKVIGDIFIRLIQMSVVLLVMTAVASALANIDTGSAGKMGLYTFISIIVFTLISAGIGLALGMLLKPGEGISLTAGEVQVTEVAAASLKETLLNFVPTNIIGSMASGAMIPCILFAVFLGLAAGMYKKQTGKSGIVDWLNEMNGIIMNIIKMVMKLAPIGIFCLLANVSGAIGFKVVIPMLKFLGCLALGDLIQFLLYAPTTAALCGVSVFKMPKKFAKMSIMAMTTTSSAICLPTKMEDEVTKFGVSREVAAFTGPITMSMNSCGAVQCYVLAILFMSQATGIALTPGQMGMAILLSVLMCMGTIVVPGGMVVTYTFLATSLGLPLEAMGVLIGIDWFSGMFRTVMNVDVDCLVAMLVSKKIGVLDKQVYDEVKTVEYTTNA